MGPAPAKPDVLPEPLYPIDLVALLREAESDQGDRTVVTRAWLKRVHDELLAAREAKAALDRVYGSLTL
jgi:hypothetical protein